MAPGIQIPDQIADTAAREKAAEFLKIWGAKYPDRDGFVAARAWDSMFMTAAAMSGSKATAGATLRDAFEKSAAYQGAGAAYAFSPDQHVGIVVNPFSMGMVKDGKLVVVK